MPRVGFEPGTYESAQLEFVVTQKPTLPPRPVELKVDLFQYKTTNKTGYDMIQKGTINRFTL